MRSRLIVLVRVVAVLAAAAVAVGALRDPLAGIDPPEPATERGRAHAFDVERVATGFNRPTWVGVAPGDPRALWVLEQPGRVVRWRDGRRRTVIDLTRRGHDRRRAGPARARLPSRLRDRPPPLPATGATSAATRAWPSSATAASVRELLHVAQPEPNHNGGHLAFGPDGRLYVGMGDGGGAFDPERRAQDLGDKLGKLLSTDVDGDAELARRADRPAQPVALRVRPRARRGLDRRRRPGRRRGDRPRAARARRAAQEPRLERLRGHRARWARATTR